MTPGAEIVCPNAGRLAQNTGNTRTDAFVHVLRITCRAINGNSMDARLKYSKFCISPAAFFWTSNSARPGALIRQTWARRRAVATRCGTFGDLSFAHRGKLPCCHARWQRADGAACRRRDHVSAYDDHRLGTDIRLSPVPTSEFLLPSPEGGLTRIRHGGGGEKTSFICGFLACEKRLCKPLLEALPRMLRVSLAEDPASSWLVGALAHGASETHAPEAGTDALMSRLSELVFVQSIRQYIRSLPEHAGWLAGIRDHQWVRRGLLHAPILPHGKWSHWLVRPVVTFGIGHRFVA